MFRHAWRGLLDARVATAELHARLAEPRPFFAGQARDDVLGIQQRWWSTLGDGTWEPRSEATEQRHPDGSLMHLTGDLEKTATATGRPAGRRITTRKAGLTFSIEQQGRRFYAAFLDNDPVAKPTKADAHLVAEHFADFLMGHA